MTQINTDRRGSYLYPASFCGNLRLKCLSADGIGQGRREVGIEWGDGDLAGAVFAQTAMVVGCVLAAAARVVQRFALEVAAHGLHGLAEAGQRRGGREPHWVLN